MKENPTNQFIVDILTYGIEDNYLFILIEMKFKVWLYENKLLL